jgi:hypothetical protein
MQLIWVAFVGKLLIFCCAEEQNTFNFLFFC